MANLTLEEERALVMRLLKRRNSKVNKTLVNMTIKSIPPERLNRLTAEIIFDQVQTNKQYIKFLKQTKSIKHKD